MSLWPHPATPLQTPRHHARSGTHPTRSSRPSWPTRRSLLLCPRKLVAFPSLLVNKHHSRWWLWTIQHCRDRSRQFCKTLCNVLLTQQLSFKCRILSHQRIHLLLQRSYNVFHWDRVGSHARVESSKSFTIQLSLTTEIPRDSRKLSSTRDFASRPPTSSTPRSDNNRRAPLVQRFANELHTRSANKEPARHRIQKRSATMFAVYLLCVLCAKYNLFLDTEGLCNTSCNSVRLWLTENKCCANMACGWCVARTFFNIQRERYEGMKKRRQKDRNDRSWSWSGSWSWSFRCSTKMKNEKCNCNCYCKCNCNWQCKCKCKCNW